MFSRIPKARIFGPPRLSFDLDFRPTSYSDTSDPVSAIIQNVKGQHRREIIRAWLEPAEVNTVWQQEISFSGDTTEEDLEAAGYWKAGEPPKMVSRPDPRDWEDALDYERILELHRLRPGAVEGEFLPNYLPGEVEIARIVFDIRETMWHYRHVVGVRARLRRRGAGSHYRYRVVWEGMVHHTLARKSSVRPLTMGELVQLIDGISNRIVEKPPFPEWHLTYYLCEDAETAAARVRVESSIYPTLEHYYARRMLAYMVMNRLG